MNTVATPVIPTKPVESSQIHSIGHDAATNTLAVRFKGKAGEPTSKYHYANVDADLFAEFSGAASIGSYFYKHIKPHKDQFPFQKIEDAPPPADE